MPSVSESQRKLMEAAAHGVKWATQKVPQTVAKEFVAADKKAYDKKLDKSKKKS